MNKPIPALSTLALAAVMSLGGAAFASGVMMSETGQDAGQADTAIGSEQPVADTWITTKVKSELATTDGVKSMDIDVKTVNGVVTLTGVLDSDLAVKKAVAAAQSVKGVKDVDASGLKSRA